MNLRRFTSGARGNLREVQRLAHLSSQSGMKPRRHIRPDVAWLAHRVHAKYVLPNAEKYKRPLAYKGPLEILKQQGQGDFAHQIFYDQPEILSKMVIIGPPPNLGAYLDVFNEVVGG